VDWTAGYVADVDYSYGYFREINPGLLRLACLNAGIEMRAGLGMAAGNGMAAGEPLHYLELGYGRGLSINIHSAANDGVYWGTDFNPSHVLEALSLARASGSDVQLLDASFAELAARTDLPEFDVIALHGIWSWISPENRQHIVDIIRRRLKQGGLVYISYNAYPGWAAAEPLKHLITLHGEFAGSESIGSVGKLDIALKFAREVIDAGALYFKQNPAVVSRLDSLAGLDRNYLAHEYFVQDWHLMAFSEVASILGEAKLSFAASAHLLDQFDVLNLDPAGIPLVNGLGDPVLKESVRDYMVNRQFRRDIFIKGIRRLSPMERLEAIQRVPFVLGTPLESVVLEANVGRGKATLQERVYKPVLSVLAENDHEPKTVARLCAHPWLQSVKQADVIEAIMILAALNHVYPVTTPSAAARARCRALNRYVCSRARTSAEIRFLASPLTGAGIAVARMDQLLLLALTDGKATPAEQARHAWDALAVRSQRLIKDGKTLETPAENIAELTTIAEGFNASRLPVLKALGIA
jgi:SAM-dependent methyltransferase